MYTPGFECLARSRLSLLSNYCIVPGGLGDWVAIRETIHLVQTNILLLHCIGSRISAPRIVTQQPPYSKPGTGITTIQPIHPPPVVLRFHRRTGPSRSGGINPGQQTLLRVFPVLRTQSPWQSALNEPNDVNRLPMCVLLWRTLLKRVLRGSLGFS